jgi:hypothetical protein
MPLHPALARSLEAGPIGDITFFVGVAGKPMSASVLQCLHGGRPGGRRHRLATWRAQAFSNARSSCRREQVGTAGYDGVARRPDGVALYARG